MQVEHLSHYEYKDDLRPHLLDYSYVHWVVVKPPPDNITSCIMHGCGALQPFIWSPVFLVHNSTDSYVDFILCSG
jgi:hypothetical protein